MLSLPPHSFSLPHPSLFAQGDGTALQFNGSNYVQIPKTSQWDLGQSSFTLAAWFKTSMSGGYGNIIRYDGPTSGSLYLVRINPGNQIEFLLAGGGRASVALATPLTYTDNQWHHVAAVRDSANDIMKIFIDGNLVASVAGQGEKILSDQAMQTWQSVRQHGVLNILQEALTKSLYGM